MGARNPTSLNRTPKIGLGYLYLREENQLHYLRNVNYLHVNINFEQVQGINKISNLCIYTITEKKHYKEQIRFCFYY